MKWNYELQLQNHHILLLQDNFAGHICPEGLTNIKVKNFGPNLTAHIQPMDTGIIRCFKAHYRAWYIQRAIDCYDLNFSPTQIYDINQLEAMHIAELAWHDVDITSISHCWQKTRILPDIFIPSPSISANITVPISSLINNDTQNPIACAKKEVEANLDVLQMTGALQSHNWMTIESLLNPEFEQNMLDGSTVLEIFKSVKHAREVHENSSISGGDNDIDDDSSAIECPSCHEALQAAATI